MANCIRRNIPNTLTSCNLLCGCVATVFALQCEYTLAFLFIILGNVFDFFDGFSARLLKVSSPVGKELDSLADVITSGIAPSAMLYSFLESMRELSATSIPCIFLQVIPFSAFLIAVFSGLRLAKFNLDTRQTTSFIGLPTPANALLWASAIVAYADCAKTPSLVLTIGILLGIVLSCYLLVAEIPMFALKFKHFGWKGNELRYVFIIASALLLLIFHLAGFAAIIILYIILSVSSNIFNKHSKD